MTPPEFVAAIHEVVVKDGIVGDLQLLENPPGRRPNPKLVVMSDWYKGLSPADRAMVVDAMTLAAETTAFGFFAVLDGVRAIERVPGGELELWFVRPDARDRLNDPDEEELHETYRSHRTVL